MVVEGTRGCEPETRFRDLTVRGGHTLKMTWMRHLACAELGNFRTRNEQWQPDDARVSQERDTQRRNASGMSEAATGGLTRIARGCLGRMSSTAGGSESVPRAGRSSRSRSTGARGAISYASLMDRRRPLLVNPEEIATDAALEEAAERCGLHVHPKIRVASALDIRNSGLSDEEYSYALKSEFDFVIADGRDRMPHFAVEFDEPHHLSDPETVRRDRLKAAVCEKLGIPLVRIGSEFLRRERRFTLIGYLVEVWHLERCFEEEQQAGRIPWDEPFMPENIMAESLESQVEWPYWLERPARIRIAQAHRAGQLTHHAPEQITEPWPQHGEPDELEFIESWAVVELAGGGYVMGQAKLRNFVTFIGGVTARGLASHVAVADAGRQLELVLSGEAPPADAADLATLRARTAGWQSQGGRVL